MLATGVAPTPVRTPHQVASSERLSLYTQGARPASTCGDLRGPWRTSTPLSVGLHRQLLGRCTVDEAQAAVGGKPGNSL